MKRQRLKDRHGYEEFNNGDVLLNEPRLFRPAEPFMEAAVGETDTIASIALRFNTTVADLKRLNKIDKDFEIAAHKTLKIPLTPHNVLLDTLPAVHKSSGNNSPNLTTSPTATTPPVVLKHELEEKLIVASVNSSGYRDVPGTGKYEDYPRNGLDDERDPNTTDPLLGDNVDSPQPHIVLARPRNDFSFDGSDCDMNWICLLLVILALCVVIPFIYVFFAKHQHDEYEMLHHSVIPSVHHDSSRY